jgi:hypothetical protein
MNAQHRINAQHKINAQLTVETLQNRTNLKQWSTAKHSSTLLLVFQQTQKLPVQTLHTKLKSKKSKTIGESKLFAHKKKA